MDITSVIVAIISSIVGALLGGFIVYYKYARKGKINYESELNQNSLNLKQYQSQVSEHFAHTALLVSNLTRDYRSLHDYLSVSAIQLAGLDIKPTMTGSDPSNNILFGQINSISPPLDYAQNRGQVGTLNEKYGLKEEEAKRPPITDGPSEVN